jgi:hypothetical protein
MLPLDSLKKKLLAATRSGLSDFALGKSHGPRSVADRVESEVSTIARAAFGDSYAPPRSARSPEDFSLRAGSCVVYADVKTHFVQESSGFSMPNLVSIAKLKTILETQTLSLLYVFVDYRRSNTGAVSIEKVESAFVWELDWRILRIGALGKGQLQITDANAGLSFTKSTRHDFLARLRSEAVQFYARQELKMRSERQRWEASPPTTAPRP